MSAEEQRALLLATVDNSRSVCDKLEDVLKELNPPLFEAMFAVEVLRESMRVANPEMAETIDMLTKKPFEEVRKKSDV